MPGCDEIRRRLSDAVDDELPPEQRARLERHLTDCPPCGTTYVTLQRTVVVVRSTGQRPAAAPDGLHERIMRAIRGTAT